MKGKNLHIKWTRATIEVSSRDAASHLQLGLVCALGEMHKHEVAVDGDEDGVNSEGHSQLEQGSVHLR